MLPNGNTDGILVFQRRWQARLILDPMEVGQHYLESGEMYRKRDNTAKLAKVLWSAETRNLSPAEFQLRFDAIYAVAEGPATLWRLGGAANDYLRAHPESIQVPPELATALVASRLVDGRIIGLKLLIRCSSDIPLMTNSISRALESRHRQEMYGGLCELDNFLHRLSSSTPLPLHDFLLRLHKLESSSDPIVRSWAQRLADRLQEFPTSE